MAKAFSDLDIYDAKSFLRIDYDLDDMFIEMALDSAKSYVCQYTKRPASELDAIPEVSMAVLVLMAHFYDNRTIPSTSDTTMEFVLRQTLGMHHIYHKNETVDGGVFNA